MNEFKVTITYDDGSSTVKDVTLAGMVEEMMKLGPIESVLDTDTSIPVDGSFKSIASILIVFLNGGSH